MPIAPLLSAVLPALVAATPVGVPLGDNPGALDAAAARMVGAMVDYARWPEDADPLTICLAASPRLAGSFDRIAPVRGQSVRVRPVDSSRSDLSRGCHVLYVGPASLAETRRIVATARGAPVLTIAEADPVCRSEAMFCLVPARGSLSFRLNVDAVSRSQVRIDPRVLRMAKGD